MSFSDWTFHSRPHQNYFPSNLKPLACEDIYLPRGAKRSGGEGASLTLISFLARIEGLAMTLSDICSQSAATPCACHLSTISCTTLRRNFLDPAKTNMFPLLNPMYECFALFETSLTDAPLVVVHSGHSVFECVQHLGCTIQVKVYALVRVCDSLFQRVVDTGQ